MSLQVFEQADLVVPPVILGRWFANTPALDLDLEVHGCGCGCGCDGGCGCGGCGCGGCGCDGGCGCSSDDNGNDEAEDPGQDAVEQAHTPNDEAEDPGQDAVNQAHNPTNGDGVNTQSEAEQQAYANQKGLAVKSGVELTGVQQSIRDTYDDIHDVYSEHAPGKTPTITSGTEGTHMDGSRHYTGQAVDMRTSAAGINQSTAQQIANDLSDRLGKDYDVVVEPTHIHIEYDPK